MASAARPACIGWFSISADRREPSKWDLLGVSLPISWVASVRPGRHAAPFLFGNSLRCGLTWTGLGTAEQMGFARCLIAYFVGRERAPGASRRSVLVRQFPTVWPHLDRFGHSGANGICAASPGSFRRSRAFVTFSLACQLAPRRCIFVREFLARWRYLAKSAELPSQPQAGPTTPQSPPPRPARQPPVLVYRALATLRRSTMLCRQPSPPRPRSAWR